MFLPLSYVHDEPTLDHYGKELLDDELLGAKRKLRRRAVCRHRWSLARRD
jgi:hypothetical protein